MLIRRGIRQSTAKSEAVHSAGKLLLAETALLERAPSTRRASLIGRLLRLCTAGNRSSVGSPIIHPLSGTSSTNTLLCNQS